MGGIQVREYASPAENIAHAKALRDKIWDTSARDLMKARAAERARLRAEEEAMRQAEIERERAVQSWEQDLEQAILDAVNERNRAVAARLFGASYAGQNAREIIAHVARQHGLSYDLVVSPDRRAHVVHARWVAIGAVREAHPTKSLPWLGKLFNRDHTTIIHALRRYAATSPEERRPPYKRPVPQHPQPQEQAA